MGPRIKLVVNNGELIKDVTISDIDRDRQAELTMLMVTRDMTKIERDNFLLGMGIPQAEYDYLTKKYRHVLEIYNKTQNNGGENDLRSGSPLPDNDTPEL